MVEVIVHLCGCTAYALLLNVSQAYDSVNRVHLLDVPHDHGVPPHLIKGTASLYLGLHYQVKVAGAALGRPSRVGIGVKQGRMSIVS